jgi:hypothetical protein
MFFGTIALGSKAFSDHVPLIIDFGVHEDITNLPRWMLGDLLQFDGTT